MTDTTWHLSTPKELKREYKEMHNMDRVEIIPIILSKLKNNNNNNENMVNNNNVNKSLPGDRQGGFGADAKLDSLRDVGDRKLNRRATVIQKPTADLNLILNNNQYKETTTFLRVDIVGDGSCLFRAVSKFLYDHQD
ncbi:unnamed protein product [Ceutorhynchus assimilis]|uniref:OTU domain-containing protein n=1 Tax=Ceutorhynchus assimilis TaxID=467358 RepID=A0A9N9QQD7_9CUCU|nr:unnamed protein product [Ceutorhynchus assimilis]